MRGITIILAGILLAGCASRMVQPTGPLPAVGEAATDVPLTCPNVWRKRSTIELRACPGNVYAVIDLPSKTVLAYTDPMDARRVYYAADCMDLGYALDTPGHQACYANHISHDRYLSGRQSGWLTTLDTFAAIASASSAASGGAPGSAYNGPSFYQGSEDAGFNRICYYGEGLSRRAVTIPSTQLCPLTPP